jgi:hypothetical protein
VQNAKNKSAQGVFMGYFNEKNRFYKILIKCCVPSIAVLVLLWPKNQIAAIIIALTLIAVMITIWLSTLETY